MLTIDFIDDRNVVDLDVKEKTEALLKYAYDYLNQKGAAELSVSYVDNAEIEELNANYRDKDSVTDVISFAMEDEEDNIIHEEAGRVLGDIIIADEVARAQATDYGHSDMREFVFLALHGFLHLMGYDHMTDEDEKEMNALQDAILNDFGIARDA